MLTPYEICYKLYMLIWIKASSLFAGISKVFISSFFFQNSTKMCRFNWNFLWIVNSKQFYLTLHTLFKFTIRVNSFKQLALRSTFKRSTSFGKTNVEMCSCLLKRGIIYIYTSKNIKTENKKCNNNFRKGLVLMIFI